MNMLHKNNTLSHKFIRLFTLFVLFAGIGAAIVRAQEPETYVRPVRTKSYAKLPNKLIKTTQPVEVTIVNGEAYIEGDIWVGSESFLDRYQTMMTGQSVTVTNGLLNGRWTDGVVPFEIMDGFTEAERIVLINAMNHISERTNVCFKKRTTESQYIKFVPYTVQQLGWSGGQSYVGKCPLFVCPDGQEIKLSAVGNRTVRHEIAHALGLWHEQSREDRDENVEILWDNIEANRSGNFNRHTIDGIDVGSYDFDSLMHYGATAFGKKVNGVRLQTIRSRRNARDTSFGSSSLTAGDIAGINSMYPVARNCAPLTNLLPGELEVGQSKTRSIKAKELYNYTGIYMRQGQKFEFSVASPAWNNGSRETTANGYEASILDAGRRHGDLKMMALVGEIFSQNNNPLAYTGTYFRIGTSRTWTATKTGFLVALANDCMTCYGDNSRIVELTVRRTQ
jgi:hypothetical protein